MTDTLEPRRPRALARKLTIVLLATLALLALLEIGARLIPRSDAWESPIAGAFDDPVALFDPDVGWVLKPNQVTRMKFDDRTVSILANERGERGRLHPYERTPGVRRIVLLGDSVAWGWGVEEGEEFARLLEDQSGGKLEVVNLAVPGYSTDQHLWSLERRGVRYAPDLVLLCFVMNDVVDNERLRDKPCYVRDEDGRFELVNRPVHVGFDGASSTWSRFRRALAENSEFFDRVWNAFRDKRAERRSARESYLGNLPFEQICARISDPTTATNWLLGQIAQRCKAIDAPLLAFVGTHKHDRYLYDPRAKPPKDLVEPVQTAPTRALAEAGKQHGFETLSVDQALYEDIKRGEMLHVGDGHFNARGHQIVARVLGGWLRTHGYLDEEASSKSPENSSR